MSAFSASLAEAVERQPGKGEGTGRGAEGFGGTRWMETVRGVAEASAPVRREVRGTTADLRSVASRTPRTVASGGLWATGAATIQSPLNDLW